MAIEIVVGPVWLSMRVLCGHYAWTRMALGMQETGWRTANESRGKAERAKKGELGWTKKQWSVARANEGATTMARTEAVKSSGCVAAAMDMVK